MNSTILRGISATILLLFAQSARAEPSSCAKLEQRLAGQWRAPIETARRPPFIDLRLTAADKGGLHMVFTGLDSYPKQDSSFPVLHCDGPALSGEFLVPNDDSWDDYAGTLGELGLNRTYAQAEPIAVTLRPALSSAGEKMHAVLLGPDGRRITLNFTRPDAGPLARFSTPVKPGDVRATEAFAVPPGSLPNSKPMTQFIRDAATGRLKSLTSILLQVADKPVVEEYFYGVRSDDLLRLSSVTKSVTSLAYGIALDQRLVPAPETLLTDYRPAGAGTYWARHNVKVTIDDVMRMANILSWGDEKASGSTRALSLDPNLIETLYELPAIDGVTAPFMSYNGTMPNVVARIIEAATVSKRPRLVEDSLFKPLDIRDWLRDRYASDRRGAPTVPPFGHAGLYLSPRSLLAIGQMMLDKGKARGKQIVSEDWIRRSTSIHSLTSDLSGRSYGYFWWVDKFEDPDRGEALWAVVAYGFGNQMIAIVPRYDAVFVMTAFDYAAATLNHCRPEDYLGHYVLPALAGRTKPFRPMPILPHEVGYSPLFDSAAQGALHRVDTPAAGSQAARVRADLSEQVGNDCGL